MTELVGGWTEGQTDGGDAPHERFLAFMSAIELSEYEQTHLVRYVETLRRMTPVLGRDLVALELGGLSRVAGFLSASYDWRVSEYTSDLRRPLEIDSDSQDVVLMLEVLEHLHDIHGPSAPIGEIAMFTGSGVYNCLREVFRVLKPGGWLVLTTPNAASVDTFIRVLLKHHPFLYPPHVREYVPSDVVHFATSTGFLLEKVETFFSWNALEGISREAMLGVIRDLGFDPSDRGDDAFYLLKKPPLP